ncbi:Signal recognition particle protein [Entomophthora muscae]|uniref:Signal recognition particle protein n=1 Tax=Entomophthora muscae TaxID=34485 RepID=A0ACC2SFZ4_9FUNG|nr:Signal recognition particle protein [Entomophthora muscae]
MEVDTFEEFSKLATTLFEKRPDNARFSYKYKHVKGELQLKATDDITIITFTTDQLQDLKKMEKLSRSLMFLMQDIPISEQPDPGRIFLPIINFFNFQTLRLIKLGIFKC